MIGRLLLVWLLLLAASHATTYLRGEARAPLPREHERRLLLPANDAHDGPPARLAFDERPGTREAATPVLLLHGSPGSSRDFTLLCATWSGARRVLTPDLPGFGHSQPWRDDYSIRGDARAALFLLDQLAVERAHVLGFSRGGGVAIELARAAPERVASLALLAAIGVQELELFGDRELNHLVHSTQLALLGVAALCLPHFGLFDDSPIDYAYARSFYDSDQRPLRAALENWDGPTLVLHGEHDFLVPVEAAREHARIVPQAQLALFASDHFLLFREADAQQVAGCYEEFLERVEAGRATSRASASPARKARAAAPFDPSSAPPATGPALLFLMLLLAAATLVSEDLTCIGAGILVGLGRLELVPASVACFAGIFVGDLGLYALGRSVGSPLLRRKPFSWLFSAQSLERGRNFFEQRGGRAILLSRFTPGLRLPTYLAAGSLHMGFLRFAAWFALAGLLWTPLLVGFAAWTGEAAREHIEAFGDYALPAALLLVALLIAVPRLVVPLLTWRGRRALVGSWRRLSRWEFWPIWAVYLPVVPWIVWLALRHRSLRVVTAVNPGIELGGLVGESKSAILAGLSSSQRVARFERLEAGCTPTERRRRARAFLEREGLGLPLVIKPDRGERGAGVAILRDASALERALDELEEDAILQEYVAGLEFGVFWLRHPAEVVGRLFSITEKRMPEVTGDGERTLEELILAGKRSVVLSRAYFEANAGHLGEVPAAGERVRLVELGTHCRGAEFLDGSRHSSPELAAEVERVARSLAGFSFGRFDLRAPSEEAFVRGEFTVLELNGLTSEPTHVYDPAVSLLDAYRALYATWQHAFAIAAEHARRGARVASWSEVLRAVSGGRQRSSSPDPAASSSPT